MIKYYTDGHEVDEDEMVVSNQGGDCGLTWSDSKVGVFLRGMTNLVSNYDDVVASLKNKD